MQKQAGYMAAPERFAESQIPLAPRAPSIHGPSLQMWPHTYLVAIGAIADMPDALTHTRKARMTRRRRSVYGVQGRCGANFSLVARS